MKIQENVSLAEYAVFGIGGAARYFCEVKTKEEVMEAVKWAGGNLIPFFVLGAGSNILVSDGGFPGLVIKMNLQELQTLPEETNHAGKKILASAGVSMAKAVNFAVKNCLSGFEWGVGIPGTIGGSIFGNAGCFGGEMKDVVESVEIMEREKIFSLANSDCGFAYRESVFKKHPEWIILGAVIKLKPGDARESGKKILEYSKARVYEKKQASGKEGAQEIGAECAGCIFKNPKQDVSAGFLIDTAGLKGKTFGKAMVSTKHANFIVNTGGATANDVKNLIELVKAEVRKKHGIILEEEIRFV